MNEKFMLVLLDFVVVALHDRRANNRQITNMFFSISITKNERKKKQTISILENKRISVLYCYCYFLVFCLFYPMRCCLVIKIGWHRSEWRTGKYSHETGREWWSVFRSRVLRQWFGWVASQFSNVSAAIWGACKQIQWWVIVNDDDTNRFYISTIR